MIKVEITNSVNGAIITGLNVLLAEKSTNGGRRHIGPESVVSNSSGTAYFYKDRPEEEYDRTVTFIVNEKQFVRHLKGKNPVVQIGVQL